ncbi:MAG: aminotransferase class IV, partial [Dehalococcoidia bacterium]|nr:aminotransferase class IV [Dehalococcoidia bacterium]
MPPVAFHKGEYVPLEQASVGVMTHAFHYGTAVFEGIRGNWNAEQERTYIFRLREHYERLLRGCKLMHMALPYSAEDLSDITVEMVERCAYQEDIYIRPIAYKSTERVATLNLHTLEDGFTVFAIPFGAYLDLEAAAHCCISSWRRMEDTMMPPSMKISGAYVNSILAKSEAVAAGFDEAILLNQAGYVCEGTGENLFVLRGGKLDDPEVDGVLALAQEVKAPVNLNKYVGALGIDEYASDLESIFRDERFGGYVIYELQGLVRPAPDGSRLVPMENKMERI